MVHTRKWRIWFILNHIVENIFGDVRTISCSFGFEDRKKTRSKNLKFVSKMKKTQKLLLVNPL
jgi:hypothetical protein